jgi:hypothetical protein
MALQERTDATGEGNDVPAKGGHLVAAASTEQQPEGCVLQHTHQDSNEVTELLLFGTIP